MEVEHDGNREVVGEGQHPQHAVARADSQALVGGGDAGEQGFVGENHALAGAGGAGGKADEGGIEGLERGLGEGGFRGVEPGERVVGRGGLPFEREVEGGDADDFRALLRGEFIGEGDEAGVREQDAHGEDDVVDSVGAAQADARDAAERAGGLADFRGDGFGAFKQLADR